MENVITALCFASPESRAAVLSVLHGMFGPDGEDAFEALADETATVEADNADDVVAMITPLLESLVHSDNSNKEAALCVALLTAAHKAGEPFEYVLTCIAAASDMEGSGQLIKEIFHGISDPEIKRMLRAAA